MSITLNGSKDRTLWARLADLWPVNVLPSVFARFVVLVLNAGWDSPDKDVINY